MYCHKEAFNGNASNMLKETCSSLNNYTSSPTSSMSASTSSAFPVVQQFQTVTVPQPYAPYLGDLCTLYEVLFWYWLIPCEANMHSLQWSQLPWHLTDVGEQDHTALVNIFCQYNDIKANVWYAEHWYGELVCGVAASQHGSHEEGALRCKILLRGACSYYPQQWCVWYWQQWSCNESPAFRDVAHQ
jgi:hypothetical protein